MSSSSIRILRILSLFTWSVFLLSGCGPSLPNGTDGKELTKKLYLDANLEFSLTVPETWERRFVTTPQYSTAPYSVRWSAPVDDPGSAPVEIEMTVLQTKATNDPQHLTNLFTQSVPGFTSTASRSLEDVLLPTHELLGHNSTRTYRVLFIEAPSNLYQISFSAPPEHYESNRPLFDLVLYSFIPLED